jgi:hypothetical protein
MKLPRQRVDKSAIPSPVTASDAAKRISVRPFSLYPLVFLFFPALTFVLAFLLNAGALKKSRILLLVFACFYCGGLLFWSRRFRRTVDEAYDCGDYLLVRKGKREDTVPLSDITDVKFSIMRNHTGARVTLILASRSKFGEQITFVARPESLVGPAPQEVVRSLARRADQARKNLSVFSLTPE